DQRRFPACRRCQPEASRRSQGEVPAAVRLDLAAEEDVTTMGHFLFSRERAVLGLGAAAMAFASSHPAMAAAPAEFYKGRTISVIIGYSAGGGYDLYARVLAQHLGKHIPGNPTVIPQNMPGAGSIKAANYVFSVAPKA